MRENDMVSTMVELCTLSRRQGIVALSKLEIESDFLKKACDLIADGSAGIKETIQELTQQKSEDILSEVSEVAEDSELDVETSDAKVVVRVPGASLFKLGQADLQLSARPVLDEVIRVVNKYPKYKIHIQDHTDDKSISTERFPTNWELSAVRATAVLRYFIINLMNSDNTDLPLWAEKELRLINHVEVFHAKPAILQKVENRLVALQKSLEKEITLATLPQGVDLTRNQIARGENHNGFPYLSLDYPQNFSKTEMFTFRTLFWWGHYLGFSLILKGEHLESYASRLLENRNTEPLKDIYVSLAPNPWEWEINDNNFSLAHQSTTNELQKQIIELGYLKIIRVFPVTKEKFATLNWTQVGIQFWKDLTPVTLGK